MGGFKISKEMVQQAESRRDEPEAPQLTVTPRVLKGWRSKLADTKNELAKNNQTEKRKQQLRKERDRLQKLIQNANKPMAN